MAGQQPEIAVKISASGSDDVRAALRRIGDDANSTFGGVGRNIDALGARTSGQVRQAGSVVSTVSNGVSGLFYKVLGAANTAANGIGFVIGKVAEVGGAFSVAGAVAGGGVLGLVYAARTYTQSVAETVSGTKDLADGLGLSVEALSRMQAAVRINLGDGEKFAASLEFMKKQVVLLAEGSQGAVDAFGNLSLTMADFRDGKGNLKGTREQMDLLLDRIHKIKNPTTQAKSVMELFGKSAKDLGGLITEGAAGFREAEKGIEKYGTTVSEATTDTYGEALLSQARLQESLRGLGMALTATFFPFFAQSSDGLSQWLNTNKAKITGWLETIKGVVTNIRADLTNLFGGFFAPGGMMGGKTAAFGSRGNPGRAQDDDEDSPAGKGFLTAGSVKRTAEINGRLVDLDKARVTSAEQVGGRMAEVNGKLIDLDDLRVTKAGSNAEEISESNEKVIESEAKLLTFQQGSVQAYVDAGGKKAQAAAQRVKDEVSAAGRTAYNFPIFESIGKAIGIVTSAARSLLSAVASTGFAAFVDFLSATQRTATQAWRAVTTFADAVVKGVGAAGLQSVTLAGVMTSIGDAFRDFRRGFERGFQTQWARDLKRAFDDVLATVRAVVPFLMQAWSGVTSFLAGGAGVLRSFTGILRELPAGLGLVGPALRESFSAPTIEGALSGGRGAMDRFQAWMSGLGEKLVSSFNFNDASVHLAIALFGWGTLTGSFISKFAGLAVGLIGLARTLFPNMGAALQEGAAALTGRATTQIQPSMMLGGLTKESVEVVITGVKTPIEQFIAWIQAAGGSAFQAISTGWKDIPLPFAGLILAVGVFAGGWTKTLSIIVATAVTAGSLLNAVFIDLERSRNKTAVQPSMILGGLTKEGVDGAVAAVRSPIEGFTAWIGTAWQNLSKSVNMNDLVTSLAASLVAVGFMAGGYTRVFAVLAGAIVSGIGFANSQAAAKAKATQIQPSMMLGGLTKESAEFVITGVQTPLQKFGDWIGGYVESIGKAIGGHWGDVLTPLGLVIGSFGVMTSGWARALAFTLGAAVVGVGFATDQASARLKASKGTIENSSAFMAAIPAAAMGAAPRLGAALFGRNFALIRTELNMASATLTAFATRVAGVMSSIGERLGLVRAGGNTFVGAGIVALTAQFLWSTGILDAFRGALMTVTVAMALLFYSLLITTVSIKFFIEGFILGARVMQLFYATTVIIMGAFRTLMVATWVFLAARSLAFWVFMGSGPLQMILGIALIVTLVAVAVVLILRHFGGIKIGWEVLSRGMVSVWQTTMDAIGATSEFLTDIWRDGFFSTMGTLIIDLWQGFANMGIWAWNQIKKYTGLEKVFGKTNYYGSDEEIQKGYNDSLKKLGIQTEDGARIERQKNEPGMPSRPMKRTVADPLPGADANDIITGSDGAQRPKVEELRRLQAAEDARFEAAGVEYRAERQKVLARRDARKKIEDAQAAEAANQAEQGKAGGPGVLDKLRESLLGGTGADGKPTEGLLSGFVGGLGLGGDKAAATAPAPAATAEEIRAYRRSLTEDGFPAAQVQQKVMERYGPKPEAAPGAPGAPAAGGMAGILGGLKDALLGSMPKLPDLPKMEMPEVYMPKLEMPAGLDMSGLVNAVKGAAPVEPPKTEFADGPLRLDGNKFKDGYDDRERILAERKRKAEAEAGGTDAAGGNVVGRTIVIEPGDNALYGNAGVFDKLIEQLNEFGARVRTEPARAS